MTTMPHSEARVQSEIRLEAVRAGVRLFRNNSGAFKDDTGRLVRYGLGNESAALNAALKSSDLIGLRPRLITLADVGTTIAQFLARECKHPNWKYHGSDAEIAQKAFIDLVTTEGGDAAFATEVGTL